jgi:hypothetical protein
MSNGKVISDKSKKKKKLEAKWSYANPAAFPKFACRDSQNREQISVRKVSVLDKIRSHHLQNTNIQPSRSSSLPSMTICPCA